MKFRFAKHDHAFTAITKRQEEVLVELQGWDAKPPMMRQPSPVPSFD